MMESGGFRLSKFTLARDRKNGGKPDFLIRCATEDIMTAIRIPNHGSHITQIDALLLAIDLRTEIDHGLRPSREKQRRLKLLPTILHRSRRAAKT